VRGSSANKGKTCLHATICEECGTGATVEDPDFVNELRGLRGRIGIVMDECHMGLPVGGGVVVGEHGRRRGKTVAIGIEMSVGVDGVRGESVRAGVVAGDVEGEGRVGDCEGGHVGGVSSGCESFIESDMEDIPKQSISPLCKHRRTPPRLSSRAHGKGQHQPPHTVPQRHRGKKTRKACADKGDRVRRRGPDVRPVVSMVHATDRLQILLDRVPQAQGRTTRAGKAKGTAQREAGTTRGAARGAIPRFTRSLLSSCRSIVARSRNGPHGMPPK
jgi:hypothetical protein